MSQVPLFVHIKAPTPDAEVSPAAPPALGTPVELDFCGRRRCEFCGDIGSPVMLRWSLPPDRVTIHSDKWMCNACMRGC